MANTDMINKLDFDPENNKVFLNYANGKIYTKPEDSAEKTEKISRFKVVYRNGIVNITDLITGETFSKPKSELSEDELYKIGDFLQKEQIERKGRSWNPLTLSQPLIDESYSISLKRKAEEGARLAEEEKLRQDNIAKANAELERQGILKQEQELEGKYGEIYPQLEQSLSDKIKAMYIPQRRKVVAEEAALGRLRSPASIPNLAKVDESQNLALSQGLGEIASQRATGELNLANMIQGLLSGTRAAQSQATQFGSELALKKQTLAEQIRDAMEKNRISREELEAGKNLGYAKINASLTGEKSDTLGTIGKVLDVLTKGKGLIR